ncbi:NAD-P-binding protein [Dentipellis sp. KUC8613]|nr:NAD-P-binding protein [Dentipellis sp. KUC8613]
MSIKTFFPSFPFTERHDVYPEIDPEAQYKSQTHKGKVVFITGASRGIGEELAVTYAKAGASLVLAARTQKALDEVKAKILRQVPAADILTVPTDVVDLGQVEAAVKAGVDHFGKLDIVIANAGKADDVTQSIVEKDPLEWWKIVEVNVRGVYNVAHFALPYLSKTNGYFLVTSSMAGTGRYEYGSPYSISKEAANAFVEFLALEFPTVKAFALHPGVVDTEMTRGTRFAPTENVRLAPATYLYLTAGKADWLSGRYISVTWDMGELQKVWKDKILESSAFVHRISVPA